MVEDNENVCSMIQMFLKRRDPREFIHDGKEGYEQAISNNWDVILLDWMLPGMDGMTICRKIREAGNKVPIIMLTAKDSESEQVLGLEMGADDYVTKPFSPLALMARIKAVKRRAQLTQSINTNTHVIETTHFKIYKDTREVYLDHELVPNLTPKEFDLLTFLVQHPKQVFTREQILEQVWGYQFYGDERTVDVHIKRLRKKLSKNKKCFFHTVWGVGYKFDELVDQ